MSKAEQLLSRLIVARDGKNTAERQAQARIKTREYLDRDRKELKAEGNDILAVIAETRVVVIAKRAEAEAAQDINLVEVYDAALSVFTTFNEPKEAV